MHIHIHTHTCLLVIIIIIWGSLFRTSAWTTAEPFVVPNRGDARGADAESVHASTDKDLASDSGSLSGPEWRIPGGNFSGRLKWIWSTLLGAWYPPGMLRDGSRIDGTSGIGLTNRIDESVWRIGLTNRIGESVWRIGLANRMTNRRANRRANLFIKSLDSRSPT